MIRANNQAALTTLIAQLHPPLNKILYLQYTTLALIALIVINQMVLGIPVPIGVYHLFWVIGEVMIGWVYRKMLARFGLENGNEYLNEKAWLRKGKQRVVAFRYIKFVCLLFNILGVMQVKQFIGFQSLGYFFVCLLYIPLCLIILIKTKDIELLLQKINRVMNNFDIDFQQDKESYLNQMSIQQQKLVSK